jgi:hypothetical protein
MPRATTLLPDAQEWRPGDFLSMYPDEKAGGIGEAPLVELIPGRALAFATRYPSTPPTAPPDGTWAFVVEPLDSATSRLVVRTRGVAAPGPGVLAFERIVFEPMHFVMERRMMEGVQRLAEGHAPHTRLAEAAEILAWTLSVALVIWGVGATLWRERWALPFGVTVLAAVGFLGATLLQPPGIIALPIATFLVWVLLVSRPRLDTRAGGLNRELRPTGAGLNA